MASRPESNGRNNPKMQHLWLPRKYSLSRMCASLSSAISRCFWVKAVTVETLILCGPVTLDLVSQLIVNGLGHRRRSVSYGEETLQLPQSFQYLRVLTLCERPYRTLQCTEANAYQCDAARERILLKRKDRTRNSPGDEETQNGIAPVRCAREEPQQKR